MKRGRLNRDDAGLGKFLQLLRAEPNKSLRYYASKLNFDTRQLQKWTHDLEVVWKLGRCPLIGRANVKLWRISLPTNKQQALNQ